MATTIDATWITEPTDSALVSSVDDEIAETRANIVSRFANEHYTYEAGTSYGGSAVVDGWHMPGSAKAYCDTSTPELRPDESTSLSAADEGRLFIRTAADTELADDQANELLFYDGTLGAWTELNYFSETVKFADGFIVGDVTVTAAGAQGILFYDSSYVLSDISASTDTLAMPAGVNFSPETDGGCDLGSGEVRWGKVYGDAVYGAVGNDYADSIDGLAPGVRVEWGRCYVQRSHGICLATAYAQRGVLGVATRTASFYADNKRIGGSKIPLAVAGYALAVVDRRYKPGTPLTSGPQGVLTRARWWTKLLWPERIIGVYVRNPGDKWGQHLVEGMTVVKVV